MSEPTAIEAVLARPVAEGRAAQSLGEMTAAAVAERAEELGASAKVPAMARRLAPLASAWRDLARLMERNGATTVAELPAEEIAKRADRLWLVPPGQSLI